MNKRIWQKIEFHWAENVCLKGENLFIQFEAYSCSYEHKVFKFKYLNHIFF